MAREVRCVELSIDPENLCLNKKQLNDIVKDTLNDTKLFASTFHTEVLKIHNVVSNNISSNRPIAISIGSSITELGRSADLLETINSVNGDTFPVYTRFFYKYLLKTYHSMLQSQAPHMRSANFTSHTGQTNLAEGLDLILCIRKGISFINAIEHDKALDFKQWFEYVWFGTRQWIMIEAFKRHGVEEPFIEHLLNYSKEYNKVKNTDKFQWDIHNDLKIMFAVLKGTWIELGTQGHSVPKFFKTLVDKYGGSSWDYELHHLNYITSSYDCDLDPDISDPVPETSSDEPSSEEDPSEP